MAKRLSKAERAAYREAERKERVKDAAAIIAPRGKEPTERWVEVALQRAEKGARRSRKRTIVSTLSGADGTHWEKLIQVFFVRYVDGEPMTGKDEVTIEAMDAYLEDFDKTWRVWVTVTLEGERTETGGSRIGSPAAARGYLRSNIVKRYGLEDAEGIVKARYEIVAVRRQTSKAAARLHASDAVGKRKSKPKKQQPPKRKTRGIRLRNVEMGKPQGMRSAVAGKRKKGMGLRRRPAKQKPRKGSARSPRKNGTRRRR